MKRQTTDTEKGRCVFYSYSLNQAVNVGSCQCFLLVQSNPCCECWPWSSTSVFSRYSLNQAVSGDSRAAPVLTWLQGPVCSEVACMGKWLACTGVVFLELSCEHWHRSHKILLLNDLLAYALFSSSWSSHPVSFAVFPVSSSVTGLKGCRSFQKQMFRSFTAQQREVRMLSIILFGVHILSAHFGALCVGNKKMVTKLSLHKILLQLIGASHEQSSGKILCKVDFLLSSNNWKDKE